MKQKNGYFSSWMGNLGVVPLFLFFAFLFFPTLVFLFFLLDSVTAVLETIATILTKLINFAKNLSSLMQKVKGIILIFLLINDSHAESNLLISKGEIKYLPLSHLEKLAIGNPEIISQTISPNKKGILIRGKMVGFSELKIWTDGHKVRSILVHVIKKEQHLIINQILNTVKKMRLVADLEGMLVSVRGVLKNEIDHKKFLFLLEKYPRLLNSRVILSEELKNSIYNKILPSISNMGVESIDCHSDYLDILCFITPPNSKNDSYKKYLSKKYGIKFIEIEQLHIENYLLKFKLIQIEKQNGESIGLNFDYSPETILDLFRSGLKEYLKINKMNFQAKGLEVSTIAEPEIITLVGNKAIVEIGSDIFYPTSEEKKDKAIWKFAGIKTELQLVKKGKIFLLNYKTEMTKPFGEHAISGNKESSTALIELNKPIQLFQIGFKTEGKSSEGLPIFQNIPILREIFGTASSHSTYKRISGFLLLEEYGSAKNPRGLLKFPEVTDKQK